MPGRRPTNRSVSARNRARHSAETSAALRAVNQYRVGHLATADGKGKPLVVPLCFACQGSCIYSVVDEKPKRLPASRLRRVRNIQANPRVALIVDHYEEDWARLSYIVVEGSARLLTNGAEHRSAIRALRKKYPQYRKMALAGRPVIKISPRKVLHWKAG